MSVAGGSPASGPGEAFRWQALFQRSGEALFVLNRHCRVLFVNTAWEKLVGLPLVEVRGRFCRRPRPVGTEIADPEERERKILAHALTPPPEVLAGRSARTRRLLPGTPGQPRWWEVEFLPFRTSAGELLGIVGRILPLDAVGSTAPMPLPERLILLRERALQRPTLDGFGSSTPALRCLAEQVRLAAGVRVPVLFIGEAGTGKQTLARILHSLSSARENALACVDCERLPLGVLADLLFGPAGLAAHGISTLYLREPGRLPRELQERLLPLLAATTGPRVLAGCRESPDAQVNAGRLLESLAFALRPLTIAVPPLRECKDELLRRIEAGLERLAERDGKLVVEVSEGALALLRDHPWPGNVRELFEVLVTARERVKGERIEADDLPLTVRLPQTLQRTARPAVAGSLPLDTLLQETERRLIELALERARGHKTRAAELLGIWRQRLVRRMEALGIPDPDAVPPGEIQMEAE